MTRRPSPFIAAILATLLVGTAPLLISAVTPGPWAWSDSDAWWLFGGQAVLVVVAFAALFRLGGEGLVFWLRGEHRRAVAAILFPLLVVIAYTVSVGIVQGAWSAMGYATLAIASGYLPLLAVGTFATLRLTVTPAPLVPAG